MPPTSDRGRMHRSAATQEEQQMDITAIFRIDRCRVFRQRLQNPRERSRFQPQSVSRTEDATGRLPPAIVAVDGINGVATQDEEQMDIAANFRGDHCRVVWRRSSEIPGNSSKNAWEKKLENRGSDLFRAEKPCKTQVRGGQNRPKAQQTAVKTVQKRNKRGSKQWQREQRWAVQSRVPSRWSRPGASRVLGVSFQDRSK